MKNLIKISLLVIVVTVVSTAMAQDNNAAPKKMHSTHSAEAVKAPETKQKPGSDAKPASAKSKGKGGVQENKKMAISEQGMPADTKTKKASTSSTTNVNTTKSTPKEAKPSSGNPK